MLKLVLALSPVTLKDTVVPADWFVAIMTLDIWMSVTLPLIAMSTVLLFIVAGTVATVGPGVMLGVARGVGDDWDIEAGVGVGTGILVGEAVESGEGTEVGVGVAVGIGVGVGEDVGDEVGVGVGDGVAVGVGV